LELKGVELLKDYNVQSIIKYWYMVELL
jgi:hypothetical protein